MGLVVPNVANIDESIHVRRNAGILELTIQEIKQEDNREAISARKGDGADNEGGVDGDKLQAVGGAVIPCSTFSKNFALRIRCSRCIIPISLVPDVIGILLALTAAHGGHGGCHNLQIQAKKLLIHK